MMMIRWWHRISCNMASYNVIALGPINHHRVIHWTCWRNFRGLYKDELIGWVWDHTNRCKRREGGNNKC